MAPKPVESQGWPETQVDGHSRAGVNSENPGHHGTSVGRPSPTPTPPPPSSTCRATVHGAHDRSTHTTADTGSICAHVHRRVCTDRLREAHGTSHMCHKYMHRVAPHTKTLRAHIYGPVDTPPPPPHTHRRAHSGRQDPSPSSPLAGEQPAAPAWASASSSVKLGQLP